MADTIDINNFNAWRKSVNPNAEDYVAKGGAEDSAAVEWAIKNGYDNSKKYTVPATTQTNATTTTNKNQTKVNEQEYIGMPVYDSALAKSEEQAFLDRNMPEQGTSYLDRLGAIYPAPKPYTPQQEQRTRNAATIAESLKSLAEIYGGAKGAYIRNREPIEMDKAEKKILYERNKYDSDLRDYARAYIQASGQDTEYLRNLKAKAAEYGKDMAAQDYLQKKNAFQMQYDYLKDEAERKRKDAEADERKRENDRRYGLDAAKFKFEKDKEMKKDTIPVYIDGKEQRFPRESVNTVVARAIQDGVAGTTRQTRNRYDLMGNVIGKEEVEVPITPSTSLTDNQIQGIFEANYKRYLERGMNIRQGLTDYDKAYDNKKGITAEYKRRIVQEQKKQRSQQTSSGGLY